MSTMEDEELWRVIGDGMITPDKTDSPLAAIAAAVAAEREACAKACEDANGYDEDDPGASFAAVIRARAREK